MAKNKVWNDIEKLSKDEILDLLFEYDNYVGKCDGIDLVAVCIEEFYQNDYRLILEER